MPAHACYSLAAFAGLLASCHPPPVAPRSSGPQAARSATPQLSPAARLARANQRLELSAYAEAEAEYRALLNGAEGAAARAGLGQILVKTGRAAEAISTLTPLLGDAKWAAIAALYTARAQQSLGRLREAEASL